jgi:hypothetical protein
MSTHDSAVEGIGGGWWLVSGFLGFAPRKLTNPNAEEYVIRMVRNWGR